MKTVEYYMGLNWPILIETKKDNLFMAFIPSLSSYAFSSRGKTRVEAVEALEERMKVEFAKCIEKGCKIKEPRGFMGYSKHTNDIGNSCDAPLLFIENNSKGDTDYSFMYSGCLIVPMYDGDPVANAISYLIDEEAKALSHSDRYIVKGVKDKVHYITYITVMGYTKEEAKLIKNAINKALY